MPHILPLADEIWQRLLAMGEPLTCLAGTLLIDKTQARNSLCLVTRGNVEVTLAQGDRLVLRAPTLIGELSVLSGQKPLADVFAQTDVNMLRVPANAVWAMSQDNATAFRALCEGLASLAFERLQGNYHPLPYLAFIAQAGREDELLAVVAQNRAFLKGQILLTDQKFGQQLSDEHGLQVHRRVHLGPFGGAQELGALVAASRVQALVCFRDPSAASAYAEDMQALLRVCDAMNVPVATNPSTARHLFASLARAQLEN